MEKETTANDVADNLQTIDQRLCFALYSSSQAIIKNYKTALSDLNMTYPQYLVYLVLDQKKELTVSQLGNDLFLDSGTLTPLLKRMEGNGLVTRKRDAVDERKVMVSLTKEAAKIRDDIAKIQRDVSCSTGLEREDFLALLAQLKVLHTNLRS